MCNQGVLPDSEGNCKEKCTDENCKYCGKVNEKEKCLVGKDKYSILIT